MSVSRHTVWFWSLVCVGLASDNNNLKELGVVESKRGAIRKGLVQELLYAQDTQVMPEDSLCARHTVEFVNPT